MKEAAETFGKGLKAVFDWKRGDVLALYTPNCVDTPAVMWGTLWAGGIISPANPTYTVDELTFQLQNSEAKAIVTQLPFLEAAQAAAKKAGISDQRIILIGDQRDPTFRFQHFTNVRNLSGATRYRRVTVDPKKTVAFLVYSSG